MATKVVLALAHAFVAFTSLGDAESFRQGPPVLPGPTGQAIVTPREKMAMYEWGEWTSYSPCSRPCGVGVRYRSRYCVKFSSTQFVTMPTLCPGEEKAYELCNTQTCGSGEDNFVDEQCAAYNRRRLQGRFYRWRVRRIDPSERRLPPCVLVCVADKPPYAPPFTSGVKLSDTVIDGTPCNTTSGSRGVCIRSQCLSIGCDNSLYSTKTFDRCGVCGGDNSRCRTETGTATRVVTEGYKDVLVIPARARHIRVVDVDNTTATFAIRTTIGSYPVNSSHTYVHLAGTTFFFQSTEGSGGQRLEAKGPTNENVHIAVLTVPSPTNRYITLSYEYTLPRATVKVELMTPPLTDVQTGRVVKTSDNNWLDYTKRNGTMLVEKLTENKSYAVAKYISANGAPQGEKTESTNRMREKDSKIRAQLLEMTKVGDSHTTVYQTGMNPHTEHYSSSSKIKDDYIDKKPVILLRRKNDEYAGAKWVPPQKSGHAEEKPFAASLQSGWYSQGNGSAIVKHDDRYTDTIDTDTEEQYDIYNIIDETMQPTTNEDHTSTMTPTELDHEATTAGPFDNTLHLEDVVSEFHWKTTQTAPCSATCNAGVRIWAVQCYDSNNVVVEDDLCAANTKPEPKTSRCDNLPCKPKWLASGWSKCSVTCGEGQQFRNIRCWRMLAAGFKTSVHASLCATLVTPPGVQRCRQIDCGPLWEMSEWSQCSSYCNDRHQTRHVRCLAGDVDETCNPFTRPTATRACSPGTCNNEWRTRSWGECTGACDKGVQRRQVTCHGPMGHLLHDKYCDQDTKPLSVKPCDDKADCPAVWVPQDWGLCSVLCGDGVTRRHVICAHVVGGQSREVSETECRHLPKPHTFGPCKEKTCESRWYTTEWSQCSKTCGSGGVRVRGVKCYDRKGVRSYSCSRHTRPEVDHNCDLSPCQQPTTSGGDDDDCQDSERTSCHLVLDFLLCDHWFYKKACCRTCRDGAKRANDSLARGDSK